MDDMAYVIDAILGSKRIKVASIIYHVMIKASEAKHPIGSFPFPILVTKLMVDTKVPFKVVTKRSRAGLVVGFETLERMSLMTKDGRSSSIAPLQPASHRFRSAMVKLTMMGLLHGLMKKVTKVLKNQKTLASNQKLLATSHNANHPDQ